MATSIDFCSPREKSCLKTRTYLKGFGEAKDGVPVNTDILAGGILFTPHPAPDYYPVNVYAEEMERIEKNCFYEIDTHRIESWKSGDPRMHNVLPECTGVLYIPMHYGNFQMNSEYGNYLWKRYCVSAIPDRNYIAALRKVLASAFSKFETISKTVRINGLMINDTLYCISWFDAPMRHRFIKLIGQTLCRQGNVTWVACESAHLLLDDGLRMLLAISLGAGLTLEKLHIWHLFRSGQLPILPPTDVTIYDPFIRPSNNKLCGNLLMCLWEEYVMTANYTISEDIRHLILITSLQCLSNLTVLSVEYSYLTGGQGNSLCQLGCIKSGSLRYLNLLFTESNDPEVTKRYISAKAWRLSAKLNNLFRVNLICISVINYETLRPILTPYMPLEGFNAASGVTHSNEMLWLGSTMKIITDLYKRFIRRIHLQLCRPRLMMDLIITKLLMQLSFLEEFVYRGPIDRLTTLDAIFLYVLTHNLRIKKLHFHLQEDPCFEDPYHTAINNIYQKYEGKFLNKNIDFVLELCKI